MSITATNKNGVPAEKAIKDAIKNYEKQLNKEMVKAVTQAAIVVEARTKRNIMQYKNEENALIDTGRLINSYTHEVLEDDNEVIGFVGTHVNYAVVHEVGLGVKPRPHLQPALSQEQQTVNQLLAEAANKAARKVGK